MLCGEWDDLLPSEHLDSGFMPDQEKTQNLPGDRPQPTRRKLSWIPHQIPLLYIHFLRVSLSLLLLLFCFFFGLWVLFLPRFSPFIFFMVPVWSCATEMHEVLNFIRSKFQKFHLSPLSQIIIICQLWGNKHCRCCWWPWTIEWKVGLFISGIWMVFFFWQMSAKLSYLFSCRWTLPLSDIC